VPAEETVRELWELGMAHLPPGDTEERIRLLGVRAGWPFAFSPEGYSQAELEGLEQAGLEAAEMALRMDLPNRASAGYDQALGPWIALGWYGRTLPIWERRAEIIDQVTDIREIGDFYAMGSWTHYELGRYARALEIADAGLEAITGRDPSSELHIRGWRIATLYRLGRWDEALDEYPLVRRILDDREDDPPYFATHAFGAVGVIYERRGERVQSDSLAEAMTRMVTRSSGRLYPSLLRFLVVRRELPEAEDLRRPRNWAVHAASALEAESERLAAAGKWDEAADLAADMRNHAERADAPTVVAFADRLEGRAALARGDLDEAQRGLERAAGGFETLGVPWERALTELDLARASSSSGKSEEAGAWAARAAATFDQMGDVHGLAAARALTETG
jgi:tetratricopeptide (TPR) repeat protein